jgi:uncharacterized phage infection (PIP) family protein YhgE
MSRKSLSQLAQTAQELTLKLQTVNNLVSKSWCEHELAREMLRDLMTAYDAWQESLNKR